MKIDKTLLKKYAVNGPRYTSYPTALQFTTDFSVDDYLWHIERSNQDPLPKPLSLYLHIPFCQSLCYYCGCHKFITQNQQKVTNYLNALHHEIQLQSKLFDKDREVRQLHFGGGTPTYLTVQQLNQLYCTVQKNFTLAVGNDIEVGIEIDPRTSTKENIETLAMMGFNRMSFGIQDFDVEVQHAINRHQDKFHTLSLLESARSAGVESISVDLIYGLPKQTYDSFQKTLTVIAEAKPDRISLYHYAHMPQRIKSQRLISSEHLPTIDEKIQLFTLSIEAFTASGYRHIGMDHFALPDDPLNHSLDKGELQRNFQGYSTHGDCDIIGLGVSAISRVSDCFSQNHKDLVNYQTCIRQQQLAITKGYALSMDDKIRAAAIQQLMCNRSLHFEDFGDQYHITVKNYFKKEFAQLQAMADEQLLTLDNRRLSINNKGRLFLRNIAMIFDAYLPHAASTNPAGTFSKVL